VHCTQCGAEQRGALTGQSPSVEQAEQPGKMHLGWLAGQVLSRHALQP
jgi:hypothetical protein